MLREKSFARPHRGGARARDASDPQARARSCRCSTPAAYRAASSGPRFDVRRTLRRSLRTQGEPFDRAWRERGRRTRPLVLILDISGSMAPYSRALMQFAFAAMAAGRRVEVVLLRDAAHAGDADAPHEGSRPRAARDRHARRGLGGRHADRRVAEGALLDGWSQRASLRGCGRRALLGRARARRARRCSAPRWRKLRRLVHRIVWVNPLKGSPALRAARARHGGGAPDRRRVPVGSQPGEPRGAQPGARILTPRRPGVPW